MDTHSTILILNELPNLFRLAAYCPLTILQPALSCEIGAALQAPGVVLFYMSPFPCSLLGGRFAQA